MPEKKTESKQAQGDFVEQTEEHGKEMADRAKEQHTDLVGTAAETQAFQEDLPKASTASANVPAQFQRMPDDVKKVALAAYQDSLDHNASEEHAITNGVIAGQNWAKSQGKPYRKN